MNLQHLVAFCRALPHAVEAIKWGTDRVLSIRGGRMFCVFGIADDGYTGMSFKFDDDRSLEMTDRPRFIPAPCMARARRVSLAGTSGITENELQKLIRHLHHLYLQELPKKARQLLT